MPKQVITKDRKPPRIIIPQGKASQYSDFDKKFRRHTFITKNGYVLPKVIKVTRIEESPESTSEHQTEEYHNSIDYIINEN